MNLDDAPQDSPRSSRILLGIALVVVLLVAAGALFLVWRPGTYTQTVAALTETSQGTSDPMERAGATPVATQEKAARSGAEAVAAVSYTHLTLPTNREV